ncbi:MAG: hypothetical protein MRZ63_02140 [Anaerostipes sp.]|nr:hypothetical protein [Anaerostipes sp.]
MKKKHLYFSMLCILIFLILSGCVSIDKEQIARLNGDYQAQENGIVGSTEYTGYWHLYIHEEEISFYDNEAGNPGMAGTITNLTKDQITVRIDMDNFEECPGDWQIVDGTIILNYNIEETKLILKNSGCTIIFDNQ